MKKSRSSLPKMYSVSDLQRDYPMILRDAKKEGEPIYLMKQNKPEAVLLTIDRYESMYNRVYEFELAEAKEAIRISEEEFKNGTIKKYTTMEDLLKD